ncbi:MAG: OmpA family protein [Alphaproteobacteria bacterium]|nr:OmpA family protein [Alphaproteobacteria bacterium]
MSDSVKAPKLPEPDGDDWLVTYADIVTLLFAFFVLLFSLATLDPKELGRISSALKDRGFISEQLAHEDPYQELTKELELSLGASGYDQYMVVSMKEGEIDIELSSSSFFQPGSAKFLPAAVPMLDAIVPTLKKLMAADALMIAVEGHTDNSPIDTEQFPSNWELSAARAANTVRFLIARGLPADRMKVMGFGDTQPKAPNQDQTGAPLPANQELNRRVVVKVVKAD